MKRILITGSTKLARSITNTFTSTPWQGGIFTVHNARVDEAISWNDYDIFINNAHVKFRQTELLWECFGHWGKDATKHIINISSRAHEPNISKGYLYSAQKAALNHLASNLVYNSDKKCKMTTLNLGLMNHDLPSLSYQYVAGEVYRIVTQYPDVEITEVTIQHKENYRSVQDDKEFLLTMDKYKTDGFPFA